MRTWAIICYTVAALAEGGGVVLVVLEFRQSRRALQRWVKANPNDNQQGSWGQILELNGVITGLLGTRWRRLVAVGLIVLGIVAGTVGNFASLPSASPRSASVNPGKHWWQQTVWHDFVFSSFGSAAIAGLFAVLVARLTVQWTTAKTGQAAQHQRSQQAAEELTRAFAAFSKEATAAPAAAVDQNPFLFAVALQMPLVDDIQLASRVNEVSNLMTDFADWKASLGAEATEADFEFVSDYLPKLMAWVSWLLQCLASHRTDHALPDRAKLPQLPPLPEMVSSGPQGATTPPS
jgi:hypothetical protein